MKYVEDYKKHYCTLCYGMRKHLGFLSAVFLNYECTFLYIALMSIYPQPTTATIKFRCPGNPLKKHYSQANFEALEYVSFINYHLAFLKAKDGVQDSHGLKKAIYRTLAWGMVKSRKYQKLRKKYSTVAQETECLCETLYILEKKNCKDFDQCSIAMGDVLVVVIQQYLLEHPVENEENIKAFFRHLGMWTYLIDAYDDYESDQKKKRFNPLDSFGDISYDNNSTNPCLQSAEIMLALMQSNLLKLSAQITWYNHAEIVDNIIRYGTVYAVQKIKKKRDEKNARCSGKK